MSNKDPFMSTLLSILGGEIWNIRGIWQTHKSDTRDDLCQLTPDRLRVLAAACLYKKNPRSTTVLSQGGLEDSNRPSIASVIKEELKSLGLPENHIFLEDTSISTFSQLLELQLIALKWQPKQIIIISNEWHLPRIEAMIQWVLKLQELSQYKPQLLAAEEILLQESEKDWQGVTESMRTSDDTLSRILKEQQGVNHLKSGSYIFRPPDLDA